jgi:hypothetical protein
MAVCPNKHRKRVLGGMGKPGCQGSLEITVMVPVTLGVRRVPKGSEDILDVINKTSKKSYRVNWRTIFQQIAAGQWDLKCDECSWSLKAMSRGLTARKRRS